MSNYVDTVNLSPAQCENTQCNIFWWRTKFYRLIKQKDCVLIWPWCAHPCKPFVTIWKEHLFFIKSWKDENNRINIRLNMVFLASLTISFSTNEMYYVQFSSWVSAARNPIKKSHWCNFWYLGRLRYYDITSTIIIRLQQMRCQNVRNYISLLLILLLFLYDLSFELEREISSARYTFLTFSWNCILPSVAILIGLLSFLQEIRRKDKLFKIVKHDMLGWAHQGQIHTLHVCLHNFFGVTL